MEQFELQEDLEFVQQHSADEVAISTQSKFFCELTEFNSDNLKESI
jgi:hypothetical protein